MLSPIIFVKILDLGLTQELTLLEASNKGGIPVQTVFFSNLTRVESRDLRKLSSPYTENAAGG
jgi:hypothetical protein